MAAVVAATSERDARKRAAVRAAVQLAERIKLESAERAALLQQKRAEEERAAAVLARCLRAGRAFQVFVRNLGPDDLVHLVVRAENAQGREVTFTARADRLEDALRVVMRELDNNALAFADDATRAA